MDENPERSSTAIQLIGGAGSWLSLRILNSYRVFIALALLVGFLADPPGIEFGRADPATFYFAAAIYLLAALVYTLTIYLRRPGLDVQAYVQIYTDVLLLALAVHASGGIASGLAVLLVVPIAGAGSMFQPRHALLFAAIATLLVLGTEVARHLEQGPGAAAYPQAALLGAAFFVSALLASAFARRSAITADIARRRTRDVRKLSALNERIIQQMESGILVVDPDGLIVLANASAGQLLGDPERLIEQDLDRIAPGLASALTRWREAPDAPLGPVRRSGDDGPALQLHFSDLGEQGTLIALEDAAFIEQQLQQLKLASLGRLTAGIAHEIRNPLGAISHSTQLLAESTSLGPEDRRFTGIVLDHCQRMNAIIENVLQLSRRRQSRAETLALDQWLADFSAEVRASRGLDPDRLRVDLRGAGIRARIDPGHLRQILWNLCDNALVHGRRDDGSGAGILVVAGHEDGAAPYIDVIDDGVPIDEEVVSGIFEPFYSTRHEGTGLGLYLARELCEINHSRLHYVREERGNRFHIDLAVAEQTETEHG